MENKLAIFTQEIINIKEKYGTQYFTKIGFHSVLKDVYPGIENKYLMVFKAADHFQLYEKIYQITTFDESKKIISSDNLKQQFIEDSGLDVSIAAVVFWAYLYGNGIIDSRFVEDNPSELRLIKENKRPHDTTLIKKTVINSKVSRTHKKPNPRNSKIPTRNATPNETIPIVDNSTKVKINHVFKKYSEALKSYEVLDGYSNDYLRSICKDLGIDSKGNHTDLMNRISTTIKIPKTYKKPSKRTSDKALPKATLEVVQNDKKYRSFWWLIPFVYLIVRACE